MGFNSGFKGLTWPYHWSLFLSMMSIISGFSFTPIISFICLFFILSILDFLADLPSLSYTVNTSNLLLSAIRGLQNERLYRHIKGYADTGLAASTPVVSVIQHRIRGKVDVGLLASQDRAVASSLGHTLYRLIVCAECHKQCSLTGRKTDKDE